MNVYCSHESVGGLKPARKEKKGGQGAHIYLNLWNIQSCPPPVPEGRQAACWSLRGGHAVGSLPGAVALGILPVHVERLLQLSAGEEHSSLRALHCCPGPAEQAGSGSVPGCDLLRSFTTLIPVNLSFICH